MNLKTSHVIFRWSYRYPQIHYISTLVTAVKCNKKNNNSLATDPKLLVKKNKVSQYTENILSVTQPFRPVSANFISVQARQCKNGRGCPIHQPSAAVGLPMLSSTISDLPTKSSNIQYIHCTDSQATFISNPKALENASLKVDMLYKVKNPGA